MPNLVCLDFRWFTGILFQDEDEDDDGKANADQFKVILPPPLTLKIREIIVGYNSRLLEINYNFVEELFRVCPSLSSIKNVGVSSLGDLLKMGKCQLIKSLLFEPRVQQVSLVQGFLEHNLSNLKLSKLMVVLKDTYGCGYEYDVVLKFLNLILSSSKDSLNVLELNLSQSDHHRRIFIPPLYYLKCLTFSDHDDSFNTRIHFLGDVIGEAIVSGDLTAGPFVDDFVAIALEHRGNSNIPAGYFPCLRKVSLEIGEIENNSDKLMGFFSFENLLPDGVTTSPGDTLQTVTFLEMTACPRYGENLSKLFPNVVHLNIWCGSIGELQNWVWTAFSKLERFQIYERKGLDRDAHLVDSFFTGISPELCAKLEGELSSTELQSELLTVFERTQPYIGDSKSLKELKINFEEKLNSKFASKVTAVCGLSHVVHRTEIIFTFGSFRLSFEEIQESRQRLEPVAAFVKIEIL